MFNVNSKILSIFAPDYMVMNFRSENSERELGENPKQYPLL